MKIKWKDSVNVPNVTVNSVLLVICINHVWSSCILDALTSALHAHVRHPLLRTTPQYIWVTGPWLPASLVTWDHLPRGNPNTNQPIQSVHTQPPALSDFHSEPLSTYPNYPTARYQTIGDRAYAPEPLKLLYLDNAKPPSPAPSKETTVKALALSFHLFLCFLCLPMWPPMLQNAPPLGTTSIKSSLDLLALSYLKFSIYTLILKHTIL